MRRLTFLLTGLLLALSALPVAARAVAGPQSTPRIEAELVAMSAWAAPGSTAVVAVRQTIAPGWHTYWRNPGDSGGAPTLNWILPPDVTAGAVVWPLPGRQPLLGLMNYGYAGETYLPVPVQIPPTARPGTTLPLSVKVLILVCSAEMCVPDEMTLGLNLPIREGAAPLSPRVGAPIRTILDSAPRPAGITARVSLADGVLTLSARDGPLAEIADGPAYFFPYRSDLILHPAVQTGERGAEGLTLKLQPAGDRVAAGLDGPVEGVLATAAGAFEIRAEPGPPLPGTTGAGALPPIDDSPTTTGALVVVQALLFALLGGLILNLMPCVFPILAMKAAALSASAHDPVEARRDGLAFLAGVLVSFVALAAAMLVLRALGESVGWGFQLQSPAVIAGLALLMLAVGLNLSGVFHVGAGLQGVGSGPLARLPGGLGAFFTGVLAVVVAAPCTAPFMAFALGAALLMPWPLALAVFLALGLGLALPYVAVSLSPALLGKLPPPGPWMERLKGLLAFPMYATALWLAWVFSRQTGAEALGLLFAAGVLLALGVWLVGTGQGERTPGVTRRLYLAVGVVVLALAGATALLASVIPAEMAVTRPGGASSGPVSTPWSAAAVAAARAEGKPVLVNLTADWCVSCKINERVALSSARVAAALEATGTVYLVGDWTRRDDAITAELARHGRSGVPLYLYYAPGQVEPRLLPQLLTEGVVVEALKDRR